MSDSNELDRRLDLAVKVARQAGQSTLAYFQKDNLDVERKRDNSPVTIADRQAEQLLREAIVDAFPDDSILGEEFGAQEGTSAYRWILDPIDGTKSFISGVPLYGTLIGVEFEERSVIGVIYIPGLDECVYAGEGRGAWYVKGNNEPRPTRVSSRNSLSDGVFLTSQIDGFAERGGAEVLSRFVNTAYITRTWGDCYGYLLVATGRAEAMVDPDMHVWDAAAMQPILQEAGGTFTDWQGKPTIHSEEGVATNGLVLEEVLALTRQYPRSQTQ